MNRIVRIAPLAGVAYLVLEVAGNGSIGDFPDADTPIAKLIPYYAAHHAGIARGGFLLHYADLALALFLAALCARIRQSDAHPFVAVAALLGSAITLSGSFAGDGVYSTLGFIGGKQGVAPGALQAWHMNGAGTEAITGDGGLMILLLALAAAGIAYRALPSWLGWSALPLGLVQLTPIGFFAGLLFLAWAAVAGTYLTLRPTEPSVRHEHRTALAGPAA